MIAVAASDFGYDSFIYDSENTKWNLCNSSRVHTLDI